MAETPYPFLPSCTISDMPAARTNQGGSRRFVRPKGRFIIKSQAMRQYNLARGDMDHIDPTSIEPRQGGPGQVHKYNEADVKLLVAKIAAMKETLQRGLPAGNTVPQRGPTIVRTQAKKEYKLDDVQLDRIRPCLIEDTPNNGPKIRTYNVSDVRALADGIKRLRNMRAPLAARIEYERVPNRGPGHPEYNMFDGMSHDDAAALLAQLMH